MSTATAKPATKTTAKASKPCKDEETVCVGVNSLTKGEKWLVSLIATVFAAVGVPLIGFQWKQSVRAAEMAVTLDNVSDSLTQVTGTLKRLAENDVQDLKTRMSVMEAKQILPEARRDIDNLEQRVRVLENGR